MKLFTIIAVTIIAFSATVFAATNSKILNSQSKQLALLAPGNGSIGKYTLPAASPAAITTLQSFADSSRPDVSKIAQNCQTQANATIKNGVTTAASQNVYYNCLSASLKVDLDNTVE